jgi:hypothetical protein
MLNTNHWATLLQPGKEIDLVAEPPQKIPVTKIIIEHMESVYPRWVTTDEILALPFPEGVTRLKILHQLTRLKKAERVEARLVSVGHLNPGASLKEYRLIKGAE